MSEKEQCPGCYSYIEVQEGVGYCILCEDVVVFEEDDELDSELLELFAEN